MSPALLRRRIRREGRRVSRAETLTRAMIHHERRAVYFEEWLDAGGPDVPWPDPWDAPRLREPGGVLV
jgi:hypothetical protein